MSSEGRKASLTAGRRRLLELFQQANFGRVERLTVKSGEPIFDPPPRIVREIKFGGDNGPRREMEVGDFQLKSQIVELFNHFDELRDVTIKVIEIKHGLPFRMEVAA
jgi:hypothetical protein